MVHSLKFGNISYKSPPHLYLESLLLEGILHKCQLPPDARDDKIKWILMRNKKLSIASMYKAIHKDLHDPSSPYLEESVEIPNWLKASFYIWLDMHNKFLSREQIHKHGWLINIRYPLCG